MLGVKITTLQESGDTNLGDFDFSTVSIFVSCYDISIIKSVVRRFRVAPLILTCE